MKPTFLLTKHERKDSEFSLDTSILYNRYRELAAGLYAWSGLPEDCPEGFLEQTIFDVGAVSIKKVKGLGPVLMGAKPVNLDIYGRPYEWLPAEMEGLTAIKQGTDLFVESKTPVLQIGATIEKIRPYLTVAEQCLETLSQNLTAMQTAVILTGNVGSELEGLTIADELGRHKHFVPCIKNPGVGIQLLDLKPTDNTQNLVSTFRAMDSEILSIMGISNGTEKSSGVTDVETLSTAQPLTMISLKGLEIRQQWADKINAALGLDVRVSLGDGYSMPQQVLEADDPELPVVDPKDEKGDVKDE